MFAWLANLVRVPDLRRRLLFTAAKDNVPVRVNAVAYFKIADPKAAIVQVENFFVATSQIAQTTLRSVLGQHTLDELLSEREKINEILQGIIDEQTAPWGIKVSVVEVKDVEIPQPMPMALQLSYLQTLLEIGGSGSSTIIFPAPVDLIKPFLAEPNGAGAAKPEHRRAA
jgi:regulator of protease activity HflC (stomatin/prohibitin superfamily)